jgi:hypothetical protein
MKTQKTTAKVTKLTARFDNELKSILMRDIAALRVANFINALNNQKAA